MKLAWATGAGCAILSFDAYQLPAIQPVPLLLATSADLDSPLDSAISEMGPAFDTGFKGASYLMVHAGQLWNIQYKYSHDSAVQAGLLPACMQLSAYQCPWCTAPCQKRLQV